MTIWTAVICILCALTTGAATGYIWARRKARRSTPSHRHPAHRGTRPPHCTAQNQVSLGQVRARFGLSHDSMPLIPIPIETSQRLGLTRDENTMFKILMRHASSQALIIQYREIIARYLTDCALLMRGGDTNASRRTRH